VSALKLSVYYGERDRVGRRFLADELAAVFARHELRVSLVMRGTTGFGAAHRLRTDRLLTLSEDLPLVSVAVDDAERIEAALEDVDALGSGGLVTLERARFADDGAAPEGETKLTVYLGRRERAGGRPAHAAVVDVLHAHGVAGATVLLGVDGTLHGARRRARLAGGNAAVPLMVLSVGDGARIAAALEELDGLLRHPIVTLERVRVCRRDGAALASPLELPEGDGLWQKLSVFCSEQSQHAGAPLYSELVLRLRAAGAAGATALRGVWGYHGDHEPHGDRLLQLRRRVPVLLVTVDTPANARRWFEIVAEATAETGLVTSEIVPAFRARGEGALELAPRWEP
jgi:PII-like signaling protein